MIPTWLLARTRIFILPPMHKPHPILTFKPGKLIHASHRPIAYIEIRYLQWVNTDGYLSLLAKPPTYGWSQSTALYAGSDPGQFNDEYPAEIILV
ncbi:hypothetical protein FRC01_008446, partial [Tulasnella sp. 417]